MTDLPAPLTSEDCDCTDLDGFMLNVERLMASELVALSTHEEVAAAVFLWCRAWKQLPAASLPDDERVLAAYARLPLARFRKVRDAVLRGFVKCSDGRLYHRFLAVEAGKAHERKQAFRKKRETDAQRLSKWRQSQRETPDETRFVAEGQGQGQGHNQELPHNPEPTKNGFSVFEDSCGSQNADAPPFTEAEVAALRLEFPAVNVLADLPTLVAWAGQKGITDRGELRQALGGALRGRQVRADLRQRFNGAAPILASNELSNLVSRKPS